MRLLPYVVVAIAGVVSGCSKPDPVDNSPVVVNTAMFSAEPAVAKVAVPDYTGRWTGVEGLYLVVAKVRDKPGQYTLEMHYDLDHTVTVPGDAQGNVVVFTRDGKLEALKRTDGTGTGLKYLAGKKECLRVKDGEGYCRE